MITAITASRFRARYAPKHPTIEDLDFIGKIATWQRVEYIDFGAHANQWRCAVVDLSELNLVWPVPECDLQLITNDDFSNRIYALLYDMARENEDALGNRWVFHENGLRERAKQLLKEL